MRGVAAGVDDHDPDVAIGDPPPREKVAVRAVARGTNIEQAPFAGMKNVVFDRIDEPFIEPPEILVVGLVAPSAELDGQAPRSAFELSLMEEPESREGADDDRRGPTRSPNATTLRSSQMTR